MKGRDKGWQNWHVGQKRLCQLHACVSASVAMTAEVPCGLQTPFSTLSVQHHSRASQDSIQPWTRSILLFPFILRLLVSLAEPLLGSLHLQCADSCCG